MKRTAVILFCLAVLSGCKSTKTIADPETLPKDVALKPERPSGGNGEAEEDLEKEAEGLRRLRAAIDSISGSKVCTDVEDWRISPLGSKPCGGPATYIAYHKDNETELIPKIQEFTRRIARYNQRRNLFSDCAIEPQPSGIQCEGGKAVLLYNGAEAAE
ncbi:hypothetical protein [Chryseobacterium sp. MFBS3-17]|uniref:hypothetical protein n=1 Tax=Chryseobacterium sp. MFBS3-17 TaxID=2886689 RepID=UPI001D0E76F2|nr:hypothetical protein [Chryseobacterium sp. MFBS3-17]MCC2591069.1 hypothetical protein [Chryseobacterium sp. MFBS3-17]